MNKSKLKSLAIKLFEKSRWETLKSGRTGCNSLKFLLNIFHQVFFSILKLNYDT